MQGLPDHAHEPTLKRISKDTLVIASPGGAAVAEALGFRNVRTLDHGQEITLGDGKLRIKATVGVSQHHHSETITLCLYGKDHSHPLLQRAVVTALCKRIEAGAATYGMAMAKAKM